MQKKNSEGFGISDCLTYVVPRVGAVEGADNFREAVTVLASVLVSKIENLPTIYKPKISNVSMKQVILGYEMHI